MAGDHDRGTATSTPNGDTTTEGVKFTRTGATYDALLVAAGWVCKKRDGSVVAFDASKIRIAVRKCFYSVEVPQDDPAFPTVDTVVRKTLNALAAQRRSDKTPETEPVDIETVQRFVIRQLWAEGLFEAAEHYQNYRETRRKLRQRRAVPAAVAALVAEDSKHFPTDLQRYQFASKFARWDENKGRRETWREAIYDRVMPWLFRLPLVRGKLTEGEKQELTDAVYAMEVSPAMRVVQMAGPALDRCNVGAYNCAAAPIADIFAFPEMLYILMQGTGFGFSVESEFVSALPRIKKQIGSKPEVIVVGDSTEGWCDAYHRALQLWWDGYDATFDVSQVRPAGARLKVKSGTASGPAPFLNLMQYARNVLLSKQGRHLEDVDCHRLACMTGKIVQVGGVRRAATISLSDIESVGMRTIKSGNWWSHDPHWVDGRHLSMANNSCVLDFEGQVPAEVFMDEWLALVKSKSGERGIFNRQAARLHRPARRKDGKFICNPCAEILLLLHQFCNLSISIARYNDTRATLRKKVRLATILGVVQSTATDFNYIRPDWKKNCDDERLLGVDITGHADCPLLRYGAPGRAELMRELKAVVADTRTEFARRFGINESAADTTVKPAGNSAVLFDCASGISPRFAAYQVRWVRESKVSPIAKFLVEQGVPYADAPEDPASLYVFGFPKSAPVGATTRNDLTASQQFLNWLEWKQNWAEHSVSATLYVEAHEWPALGGQVYDNIDQITGVSFLPKDNGSYSFAPNEELTKEAYDAFVQRFPIIDWGQLPAYEMTDSTESAQTIACVGGACDA